ncbi:hypothetical protein DLAC_08428 [Tieghemostelium lacteum]|uniref:Uncharacterized protein n=1 Tax=Tieghemostelium lacteum TaxID=361077 RepID=A0A151ZBZ4_TIELA|nr:hypothetical protein DLAC_08428 [Tieghemostelium lacteum]|eukprot:KYQ91461.1 hypothetical protein DLAC_08428 [Tieghemostelium lacteum]
MSIFAALSSMGNTNNFASKAKIAGTNSANSIQGKNSAALLNADIDADICILIPGLLHADVTADAKIRL